MDVVHVATPGVPDVTVDALHPVLALHVTLPVTTFGFAFPLTCPNWPLIVAVNVTGCPKTVGLALEVTTVAEVARVALVVSVTVVAAA